jgi:hypothetical protein
VSYASGQPAICHFGLGDIKSVDVSVRLPDGRLINSKNIAADRRVVIEEP